MKKFKKLFAVMLCLLMMLTPVISDQQAVTVQAATKMTAVKQVKTKSGKRYGYDAKGKMIKNQWGKSSSGCIYYFQKNGAAYQADKDFQGRYGIVIKKIDNKYYGFDVYGHRVTGFHMAAPNFMAMRSCIILILRLVRIIRPSLKYTEPIQFLPDQKLQSIRRMPRS